MKLITFIFFALYSTIALAIPNNKLIKQNWPTVNILQWWGYISTSDTYIKKIEQSCHATISHDQYYSNSEFLRRMKNYPNNYDIIIFSDTIFKAIEDKVAHNDSSLYKLSKGYYPIIRKQYVSDQLPHNVLFFIHSLTGFLYNPKVITPTAQDDMFDLFKKAKGKIVVMLDDPVEAEFLLSLGIRESSKPKARFKQKLDLIPLTIKNFKKLYGGTKLLITNLPERIATKHDFAFAFQWSGDAIEMLKNSRGRLKFFIHPKLSYVTSDLLASLNNKRATMCVAKALGSKWFLQHEQNTTFYFSPYVDGSNISDNYFKKIFHDWKKNLSSMPWAISVNRRQFKTLIHEWDRIKINIEETTH